MSIHLSVKKIKLSSFGKRKINNWERWKLRTAKIKNYKSKKYLLKVPTYNSFWLIQFLCPRALEFLPLSWIFSRDSVSIFENKKSCLKLYKSKLFIHKNFSLTKSIFVQCCKFISYHFDFSLEHLRLSVALMSMHFTAFFFIHLIATVFILWL